MTRQVTVVGAGLTGCIAAIRFHRLGAAVRLHERRDDTRGAGRHEGRSINLALSTRGLDALERVGLAGDVLAQSVPMAGRMLHDPAGRLTFQRYSANPANVLRSVNRDRLNETLLDAVETEGMRVSFGDKLVDVELKSSSITFERNGATTKESFDLLIGADGAYSAVRARLQRTDRFSYEQEYLEHGYKELTIPAAADGSHRLDPNALHIWPRGDFMMIALPNNDGSFTCTLFWPFEGAEVAFDHIDTAAEIEAVFAEHFADAAAHMPRLVDEYLANPTSSLVTIKCRPWHLDDRILLLGDAAHAVVPFYGQGANAALEDVTILAERLTGRSDWSGAFAEFYDERKPDADALADLALDNFVEMRDRVRNPLFLLRKRFERAVSKARPSEFVPLYEMVTFSRLPYADAVQRARQQDERLSRLGLIFALAAILVVMVVALAVLAALL